MIDALTGSMTAFDAIVIAVVIMSALMAFSRGFMRELATLAALFFASIATYFGHALFRDRIAGFLPESVPSYSANLIVVAAAFLIVYTIVRLLAGRFTRLIQGSQGVNMVDRLTGLAFGVVRGLAFPFLAAWVFINIVPSDAIPEFISKSATYPYFESAASALNSSVPEIAAQADDAFTPRSVLPPDQ